MCTGDRFDGCVGIIIGFGADVHVYISEQHKGVVNYESVRLMCNQGRQRGAFETIQTLDILLNFHVNR